MNFFSYVQKYLNIHQIHILKIIKKDYEESSWKISSLSKKEKEKKWQYGSERYKNLTEEGKKAGRE